MHFAGSTANPDELWMLQMGRNLSDAEDGFLRSKKYLLMDRDAKFSEAFRVTLEQARVEAVRLPPSLPNLNPNLERLIGSIRCECLDYVIVMNESSLRRHVARYLDYYHGSRSHLSLGKDSPDGRAVEPPELGRIVAVPKVGGLHHRYERRAA